MLKRFFAYLKIAWYSLFFGMRRADAELTSGNKEEADGSSVEQQKEEHNKYAAMLRGEVTQEVRETRHEMYYAERKSHEYEYSGGGHATKKKRMFDYDGNAETSDGNKILIVQDNYQDMASLDDYGIDMNVVEEYGTDAYDTIKHENIAKKEYIIKFEYDFIPKFRLDEFTKRVIVKDYGEKRIIDVYVSKYPGQFDRRTRMFVNAVEEIYQGDRRSDIVQISKLSFMTKNAYGAEDMMSYSFKNFIFTDIIDFDGNFVLRFICEPDGVQDMIEEFYDEITAKKNEEHAPREGAAVDFDAAAEMVARDSYDADTAKKLVESIGKE